MMVESKVPGALERMEKGEMIPEWEYVTEGKLGWEYRQVLAGNILSSKDFTTAITGFVAKPPH
jgi:hypothetical protein